MRHAGRGERRSRGTFRQCRSGQTSTGILAHASTHLCRCRSWARRRCSRGGARRCWSCPRCNVCRSGCRGLCLADGQQGDWQPRTRGRKVVVLCRGDRLSGDGSGASGSSSKPSGASGRANCSAGWPASGASGRPSWIPSRAASGGQYPANGTVWPKLDSADGESSQPNDSAAVAADIQSSSPWQRWRWRWRWRQWTSSGWQCSTGRE